MTSALALLLSSPSTLLAARQKSLALAQAFDIEHVVDAYETLFHEITKK
jgi:hypothetical protein